MTDEAKYRSDIPPLAEMRMVEQFPSGAVRRAAYWLDDERVGERVFFETGEIELEMPFRVGVKHGTEYTWSAPGELSSAEPWVHGLADGVATQWSTRGEVIGTYRMVKGTGLDLWWAPDGDETFVLAEARYLRDGNRHGFEWRIREDQRGVWTEQHFAEGLEHGIERVWEMDGELRAGYPRFWLRGVEVTREAYEAACAADAELPPYQPADDRGERTFPADVVAALGPRSAGPR